MMKWMIAAVMMMTILVVLLWIPKSITNAAEESAERAACKKSLETASDIKILAGSMADKLGNSVTIDCPTKYIETSSAKEELTQEVSDYLYDCWDLFSKSANLFNQRTGTYCIICKSITINNANRFEEALVDYLKSKKAPTAKGITYIDSFGGVVNLAKGAEQKYNFYSFAQGSPTAVIVTFGTLNFKGQHLIFDDSTGIGMLLHPYNDVSSLGCYSFEGRSTSLEYKR